MGIVDIMETCYAKKLAIASGIFDYFDFFDFFFLTVPKFIWEIHIKKNSGSILIFE